MNAPHDIKIMLEFDYLGPDGIKTITRNDGTISNITKFINGEPYDYLQVSEMTSKITLYQLKNISRIQYYGE